MAAHTIVAVLLLLLAGCGGAADPAGTYETDPASIVRSLEEQIPEELDPQGIAKRRLREMQVGNVDWKVSLELARDQRFVLTMVLPLVPQPQRRSGTWKLEGRDLELTTPEGVTTATYDGRSIRFQLSPHTPRFVLEKKTR